MASTASKEKGLSPVRLRASLIEGLRGLAAGMSPAELRAMARGEEPTEKPNPRYRAHVLSFLLHIRPKYYAFASTRFSYTFHLGFFTVFLFLVEIVTGLILMVYYVPTSEGAYASIYRLLGEVPFGEALRDVHRLAAEGMVILAVLHMARTFLTASYRKHHVFTWVSGVALLFLTIALTYSGYLLPWDQLAYWAINVGTGLAAGVPWVGDSLLVLLRGSAEVGADGLLRFYLLHVILLPILAGIVISAHYYRVARHGLTLPPSVEEGNLSPEARGQATGRVNFLPNILVHEVVLVLLGLLVLLAAAFFLYDAPLEHHANPQRTPLEIEAPWFFLWVQGLLKYGDRTLMGVIVPLVVLGVLAAVPNLDRNRSRLLKRRPLAVSLAVFSLAVLGWLTYVGTPAYGIQMPAAIQISQALAPEEGMGPLRRIPYDELQPGVYLAGQEESEPLSPALAHFMADYERQVKAAEVKGEMKEAQAFLLIEEPQLDLKKLVLRILWMEDGEDDLPEFQIFDRVVYLHRQHSGGE